jgi:hypothetical protein
MMQIGSSLTRCLGATALVTGVALAMPAVSLAQTPAAPANVTGTWNMSLIGDHVIPVALVLEQTGTAVKGTFIFMGKDSPVAGELVDGTLTLTGKGPMFGRAPTADHNAAVQSDMTIVGTADADGGFAGNVTMKRDGATGTIKWTAERLKERKVPASQAAAPSAGVNVSGKWTVSIVEAQVVLDVELTQTGTTVTGSSNSEHLGAMTLEGTFASGILKFVMVGSNAGQEVRIEYTGKYKADGSFAGDLTSQMGPMTWTAERVKK